MAKIRTTILACVPSLLWLRVSFLIETELNSFEIKVSCPLLEKRAEPSLHVLRVFVTCGLMSIVGLKYHH